MSSNRPEPARASRTGATRSRGVLAAVVLLGALLVAPLALAGPAGAQDGVGGSSGDPAVSTTTFPPVENCGPGHIVRRPDCGVAPKSPTDPGGWLQVSLFYLICAAVVGITAFVWWRARVARKQRKALGLDPVSVARRSGQGVRRSTRKEPVADSSTKSPEARAGR